MTCPNCGNNCPDQTVFCSHCGCPLVHQTPSIQNFGNITIIRPSKFLGCAVNYKIYIDGVLVGKIPNNNTMSYPVCYGYHNLQIYCGMGSGQTQVLITPENPNVSFHCPMHMGLFSNTIDILPVNPYYPNTFNQ